ncbi:dienelactone hydrolase family protein [Sabulicella rubraurantiaca]|uniref:dienelactone hydrolase family protein n=1 Tax=Sabulicella rubraurantiaca TaxID=2811429 RepID=UPI001A956C5A|nr:hypothetical protein [Sabulicella rubraurantiaca]
MGILWLPDGAAHSAPTPLVIALQDATGIDSRGWHYGDQVTAAGIAVLHVELLGNFADGLGAMPVVEDHAEVQARLTTVLGLAAQDPRFANVPIGLLAFGASGQAALRAAVGQVHGGRIAGVALLYPGCAPLAATVGSEGIRPRAPILLMHGDADPSNRPTECSALAGHLGRSAPVRRREIAGAGYAWDLAPHGPHERVKLPWSGRPGLMLAVVHWPEVVELAATEVATFFAASLAARRP